MIESEIENYFKRGLSVAVNLNSNIDYFDSSVNAAAKLQAHGRSNQIVFTDAVWKEPGVKAYCKNIGVMLESSEDKIILNLSKQRMTCSKLKQQSHPSQNPL